MSWSQTKLEWLAADIPNAFVGGPFGSKLTTRDYVDNGIPVIRGSNMTDGRYLDTTDVVFVSETKMRKDLSSNVARENDLIFTQRGTLGQVVLIPKSGTYPLYVISQSQMKLTVDKRKADPRFIYYYFSSPSVVGRINSLSSSSGVPHINLTVLRNFELSVPPLETQHHIADILSAYDDLIENNRRRITLLEQAARELYREWFVRLRFPGYENTRIVDGVPDGWEKVSFSELAEFVNGYAFKPTQLGNVGLPIIKIPELKSGITANTPRNHGDLIPAKYHIRDGDLLFSWSGTLAVNYWASGDALLNQHLFVVKPRGRVSRAFLMFALREASASFDNQTVGSTMRHIRRSALDAVALCLPELPLLKALECTLSGVWELIIFLSKQNNRLTGARDLLLPRLMSGEVGV